MTDDEIILELGPDMVKQLLDQRDALIHHNNALRDSLRRTRHALRDAITRLERIDRAYLGKCDAPYECQIGEARRGYAILDEGIPQAK